METDVTNKKNPVNEKAVEKKGLSTVSIVSIIVLLVAGIIGYTLYSREHKKLLGMMEEQKVSLTEKITARDSVISEWIMTFDEIEKNIALIKEKEKVITLNSSNVEISKDKRQQVLEDITYINTLLEQNKKKIASLTAQLRNSGGTIKALQDKITGLEATMKQNEAEISELKTALVDKKFEVEQLNTQMTVLNDTIAKKDEIISTQTNEMNKAFYAVGTFKELKEQGLITKEGGFIGLGKTKSLTGNIPENVFTQIDLTKAKYILVDAKSAKLISDHPAGSYEFVRDENKRIKTIDIKDPVEFWKVSRYAVVEITK
jgi:uncharacterized coiled-coil protein SlyX